MSSRRKSSSKRSSSARHRASSQVQSILLDRDVFSLSQAKNWIKKHGYKLTFNGKKVDITPNEFRFRQLQPSKKADYRIKEITDGVKFVLMFSK